MSAPHNLEAESSVLGSVLLADVVLDKIADVRLSPDDFYGTANATMFRAMLGLAKDGEPVDVLTVEERLREMGSLGAVGGKPGIAALAAHVPSAGNVRHYATIVKENGTLRRLLNATFEIQSSIEKREDEPRVLLDRAERAIVDLSKADDSVNYDWEQERYRLAERIESPPADVFGFEFPFRTVQKATGGMPRQGMTVIGAWPKHGKSHLMDQILEHVAAGGYKAILWDLEMAVQHRVGRFLQRATGIDGRRLDLDRDEKQAKIEALMAMGVEVRPVPRGTSVQEVARDIRLSGCDIAGVDHLHKFRHRDESEMAEISGELVSAAAQGDCHVLVAAQLNRKRIVGAARPTPTLGDLRYSAMIEADASAVVFVHREEDEELGLPGTEGKLYVPATRFGDPDAVGVRFDGERLSFREVQGIVAYE